MRIRFEPNWIACRPLRPSKPLRQKVNGSAPKQLPTLPLSC